MANYKQWRFSVNFSARGNGILETLESLRFFVLVEIAQLLAGSWKRVEHVLSSTVTHICDIFFKRPQSTVDPNEIPDPLLVTTSGKRTNRLTLGLLEWLQIREAIAQRIRLLSRSSSSTLRMLLSQTCTCNLTREGTYVYVYVCSWWA